jgi:hypothetical protein
MPGQPKYQLGIHVAVIETLDHIIDLLRKETS